MIEVDTRIHDKHSIEFKTSFVTRRKLKENDFSAFMWFFVPYSLDINKETYPKSQFYQDIKSNIRLITPKFLLRDIVAGEALPLIRLSNAFTTISSSPTRTATRDYEYQIKMFAAITHSAARDACSFIMSGKHNDADILTLCTNYVNEYTSVLNEYRKLRDIINQPTVTDEMMSYYRYGDEYMSNMLQYYGLALLDFVLKRNSKTLDKAKEVLQHCITSENDYRESRGYANLKADDPKGNRDVVYRHRVLKKYVDSDLFLDVPKKKDGKFVEQLYLGIAAGLAMMFATVVSFHFQQKFGNFTLPFFIVLVISYMIKDRIKELSRYYFAHRIGSKFFDNKAEILIKDERIGTIKEGMDFISRKKLPADVKRVRYSKRLMEAENRVSDEKILLYRMAVHINREKLNGMTPYETVGINDIIRFNVDTLLRKMDNPQEARQVMNDDGTVSTIMCDKLYYINIVLQFSFEDNVSLRRYRVAMNRDGIESITEVK
ncbi:MAG: hypothetical protein MJZ74_07585 [Muribaculaceae bacterium]|nr:hypothetical protein [Muribaculaceae bacterium]